MNKTLTFRATAPITFSDTFTNPEFIDTWLRLWDESDAATRKEVLWDSMASSMPECVNKAITDYQIVGKDKTYTVEQVIKMSANKLAELGIF